MKKLLTSLFLLFCFSLSSQQLDNLGQTTYGGTAVGDGSTYNSTLAEEFMTGPNSYQNAMISIILEMLDVIGTPNGDFRVDIFNSTTPLALGGVPNVSIATLTGNSDPTAAGNYTYSGTVSLDANTSYFIVASATGPSGVHIYRWGRTNSTTVATSDGFTTNLGFKQLFSNIGFWISAGNLNLKFSLTLPQPAPIPSLGQWGLIILGIILSIIGIVAVRQRIVTTQ